MSDDEPIAGFLDGFAESLRGAFASFKLFPSAPNGESGWKYHAWVQREMPSTIAALDKHGYPITAWMVTAAVEAKLLTPKGRADDKVREQWFEYLLPIVEEELKPSTERRVGGDEPE
jgi:hypothetical protein